MVNKPVALQTITEADWYTQFKPHLDDKQTAGFVNYDYQTAAELSVLQQANAERRLWTYCQTGVGNYYITQGWAFVNREFYIICDVPVPEGEEYDVTSEESFYCEMCGEWFKDMNDEEDSVERSTTSEVSMCVGCQNGDNTKESD